VSRFEHYDAIVIGAGIAGLTAAAALAHRKVPTLVVEQHNVPGGCAAYYQRDGFRFDVGATLVGGFGLRGVHRLLNAELEIDVSPEPIEPSMVVHLPDAIVVRYGDERWRGERLRAFGDAAEPFWRRQERIADLAWDFSARFPALPSTARLSARSRTPFARATWVCSARSAAPSPRSCRRLRRAGWPHSSTRNC